MSGVYKAIAKVQGDLAKTGIAKNRKNTQGSGYNFRGIDDVYAALSPLLAEHGLVIVPRVVEREQVERASKSGGMLFYTTVKAEFDFVAVEDGSVHTASTYGEAMDSGDKSTNKAMSAAYKYAAFMTFAIPTEGDNDADAATHEVIRGPVISSQQEQELNGLIVTAGTTVAAYCDRLKVASVASIPAAMFEKSKAVLTRRIEQQEAENGAAQ